MDQQPGFRREGDIRWLQRSIWSDRVSLKKLRRAIGMVFQQPNPFPVSVYRNIELVLLDAGIGNKAERHDIILDSLERVQLLDELRHRLADNATQLSGGQKQRLCMARALVLKPKMLLMDEPCSALDPISSEAIEQLIDELKSHCSIMIVTHNLAQAKRLADHVSLFWSHPSKGGYIVETKPSSQFFSSPESPVTQAYLQSLKA